MALTTTTKSTDNVTLKTPENRKLCIDPHDVLMGRGARATENEGNVRFRQIVRNRLHDYLTAPRRQDKDQIAREILAVVKSRNGRFLRKVEGMDDSSQEGSDYAAVEDDVALLKVKQALRDQKLEESANNSQQSGSTKGCSVKDMKSSGSPVGPESINKEILVAAGLLSPAGSASPALINDSILRLYLNEQSRTPVFPQGLYPEVSATTGLLSRLGLASPGISAAMLLHHARQEALVRAVLEAQTIRSLLPNAGLLIPSSEHHLSSTLASIEAETRLNLLHSLSLTAPIGLRRPGDFQDVSDLLNMQRTLKRRRAN